jgi:hypothetical protein
MAKWQMEDGKTPVASRFFIFHSERHFSAAC